jgi:hypothetical protein
LAALCGLVVLASAAAAEPLAPTSPLYSPSAPLVDENPYVTAEYSGTLSQKLVVVSPLARSVTANLKWNTKVSGPVDQIEYTAIYGASAIHWQVSELSGTVAITEEKAPGCSASFSSTGSDGGERGVELPLDEPGFPAGGGNPLTNPDYRVAPPQGIPFVRLTSSAGSNGECGTVAWSNSEAWFGAALAQPGWEGGAGPVVYFPPGAPLTHEISPPTFKSTSSGQTFEVTLASKLKFSSPALPGAGGPTTGPTTGHAPAKPGPPIACPAGSKPSCLDKKAAQEDIRRELKPVTFNCDLAAVGIAGVVAALAVPEVSAAAFIAAEGVVGAEVSALAGTTCGILLAKVYKDAKTIEDPAEGQLGKLALPSFAHDAAPHLPSCRRFPKALSFCKRLRAAVHAYATSVSNGQALTAALLTTVDRMTGAELAHNRRALARQARHALSLRSAVAAQYSAQLRAGRLIARLLSGERFSSGISAAQTASGNVLVLSKLARRGLAESALESLAASELPTGAITAASGFAG